MVMVMMVTAKVCSDPCTRDTGQRPPAMGNGREGGDQVPCP
jgi:hypothetical protein